MLSTSSVGPWEAKPAAKTEVPTKGCVYSDKSFSVICTPGELIERAIILYYYLCFLWCFFIEA